ncbi:MAG: hypothetical protein IKE41_03830 [Clostridia bacterium]|nr:hypothetical protein [Clostridia bacterium]MBR2735230.1 hypothetical protein [Clostridia bacterium]
MPEKEKMQKEELEQVSGGAILDPGHVCKHCGKEFSVVIPDNHNSLDPGGLGLRPTNEAIIKDWQYKHYCYECLNDPTVKKEKPKMPFWARLWG